MASLFVEVLVHSRTVALLIRAATQFSVQKPFGSSKIGHRSERFCVFLPIFAGRDGEGNEQKLGEEWGQAKQWSQYFEKNPLLYRVPARLAIKGFRN